MKLFYTILILFCFSVTIKAQDSCLKYKLVAFNENDTSVFCGVSFWIDNLNFIFFTAGCEQHQRLLLFDKCHISNDTIYIDKFDYKKQSPFFKIEKRKSRNNKQQIKFVGLDGKKIDYRNDHLKKSYFARAFTKNGKRIKLQINNSTIIFPKYQIKVIEFELLSRIYNTPITFWPKEDYDYLITLNVPSIAHSNMCIHYINNFTETYFIIQDGYILLPFSNSKLKISCYKKGL